MDNYRKVEIYTRIDLKPIGEDKFYIYILPEDKDSEIIYDAWVFRHGYGVAYSAYGIFNEHYELMNVEKIKELDAAGEFDQLKQQLKELG